MTWVIAAAEALLWGGYGWLVADLPLIGYGLITDRLGPDPGPMLGDKVPGSPHPAVGRGLGRSHLFWRADPRPDSGIGAPKWEVT